jgi:hypothetical protein
MKHIHRIGIPLIVFSCSASLKAQEPESEVDELVQLTGRVRVLLEVKCKKCHDPSLKDVAGDFDYAVDLLRLSQTPSLVIPGDSKRSELFRLVRDGDMPPYDQTEIRRLESDEVHAIRRWIDAGAPTVLPERLPEYKEPADPSITSDEAIQLQLRTKSKRITIDMTKRPASEIISEIEKRSGIPIYYKKPANEPILSLTMKNRPVFDALEYIALCGNFSLRFDGKSPRIGPNPPPELPIDLPPVRPLEKRQKPKG